MQSPEQLAERARAIADRWKARLRRETRPAVATPAKPGAPVPDNKLLEDLHEQLSALGTEMARIERERLELRARNQSIEERVMAAIRDGDDRAAKTELDALQATVEVETLLEAELRVLRALVGECHAFLATVEQTSPWL